MEGKKSRVFVFDRIELALLVFFFIVVSVTAFVLGIRLGKKQALENIGITQEHVRDVELKSDKEEYVEDVIETGVPDQPAGDVPAEDPKNIDEEAFQKLQDEFEKLDRENFKPGEPEPEVREESPPAETEVQEATPAQGDAKEAVMNPPSDSEQPNILGKYTIQLGSYKTLEEAQAFAGGFVARGYKPLINEKEVNGQNWYRVSLGAFQSKEAAKAYVESEKGLFNSQVDPFITQIE